MEDVVKSRIVQQKRNILKERLGFDDSERLQSIKLMARLMVEKGVFSSFDSEEVQIRECFNTILRVFVENLPKDMFTSIFFSIYLNHITGWDTDKSPKIDFTLSDKVESLIGDILVDPDKYIKSQE